MLIDLENRVKVFSENIKGFNLKFSENATSKDSDGDIEYIYDYIKVLEDNYSQEKNNEQANTEREKLLK